MSGSKPETGQRRFDDDDPDDDGYGERRYTVLRQNGPALSDGVATWGIRYADGLVSYAPEYMIARNPIVGYEWEQTKTSEVLRAAKSILCIDQTPSGVALCAELERRAALLEREAHSTRTPEGVCDKEVCEICDVLRAIGEIPPGESDAAPEVEAKGQGMQLGGVR